jgi:chemotaxis protein histidine kinase CheA
MKLNGEQYNIAYLEYKKIMDPATISFLRRLMFDQQIQLQFENNLLIDFSNVDEDINLEQNILLNRLINHKKMRNIVKYLILKKYVKIFGEQQDDDTDSLEISLEKLIKILLEKNFNELFKDLLIKELNGRPEVKKESSLRGGGFDDAQKTFNNLLIVSIALYFDTDTNIVKLCKNILKKQNTDGSGNEIVSRMVAIVDNQYDFKVSLGPAIVSNEVDTYKVLFTENLDQSKKDEIKENNLFTLLTLKKNLIKNKKFFLPEIIFTINLLEDKNFLQYNMLNKHIKHDTFIQTLVSNCQKHFPGQSFEEIIREAFPELKEEEQQKLNKELAENVKVVEKSLTEDINRQIQELENQRLATEAEKQRQAVEAEKQRQAVEAEKQRQVAEAATPAAEAEETQRKAAEAERQAEARAMQELEQSKQQLKDLEGKLAMLKNSEQELDVQAEEEEGEKAREEVVSAPVAKTGYIKKQTRALFSRLIRVGAIAAGVYVVAQIADYIVPGTSTQYVSAAKDQLSQLPTEVVLNKAREYFSLVSEPVSRAAISLMREATTCSVDNSLMRTCSGNQTDVSPLGSAVASAASAVSAAASAAASAALVALKVASDVSKSSRATAVDSAVALVKAAASTEFLKNLFQANMISTNSSNNFQKKYLKYKQKYLQLKY